MFRMKIEQALLDSLRRRQIAAYDIVPLRALQISFIGMQTQEVAIKPNVRVVMKSESELLEEVMVVAYGTAAKKRLQDRLPKFPVTRFL